MIRFDYVPNMADRGFIITRSRTGLPYPEAIGNKFAVHGIFATKQAQRPQPVIMIHLRGSACSCSGNTCAKDDPLLAITDSTTDSDDNDQ